MTTRRGYAEIDGARIYYEIDGAGQPVVFVHGFTLDTRMWDEQVEAFARNYEVIRYDVRGFGRSSPGTSEPFSSVDDLKALLFSDAWNESFARLDPTAAEKGVDAAKDLWLAHPLFDPANARPEVAARLATMVGNFSGWHWVHSDGERGLSPPTIERLDQISAATLVVLGELDLPDFHVIAERLATQIPNARKVVLPGVGHMSNMEDPASFNAAVLEFLRVVS